jgi:hypothetical protein
VTIFGTTYSQNTNTSFVTNYTYPVPTTYPTLYPVFVTTTYITSRPTTVTEPVYRSTTYSNPTTYPGFTTPTGYPTSNPTSSVEFYGGCFYYDVNGNLIGQDPGAPPGCEYSGSGPCPFVDTTGTASVYTYYNTSRTTDGTTTFLTHVYIGQNTFEIFYTPGFTDPVNGIFGCYDANDPDVFQYCQSVGTCEGCEYFNSTTFETDVGYDTFTSAPAPVTTTFETSSLTSVTYLSSRCFPSCQFTCSGVTTYLTYVPTFYPPSTVVTSYEVNTVIGSTTYSYVTSFFTSNETFTGSFTPVNTTSVTQYPTSNVTSRSTITTYIVNTTNTYSVPTTYVVSTSFSTSFPTDYLTERSTLYVTNIPTTFQTSNETSSPTSNLTDITTTFDTSNDTTRSTTRMTEFLTEYTQNTEVLTSRSTTWFTQ